MDEHSEAAELGISFYDKEILEVQVNEGLFKLEDIRRFDEKKVGGFLYSMALNPYAEPGIPLEMMIQEIQMRAIETVARQGSCAIIGRRADKILRLQHEILRVFISASIEKRIARVSKRDGLTEKDSEKKILKADKSRRAYYNSFGKGEWGEAENYNLCIDSGDLGVDSAASMILKYLELKG